MQPNDWPLVRDQGCKVAVLLGDPCSVIVRRFDRKHAFEVKYGNTLAQQLEIISVPLLDFQPPRSAAPFVQQLQKHDVHSPSLQLLNTAALGEYLSKLTDPGPVTSKSSVSSSSASSSSSSNSSAAQRYLLLNHRHFLTEPEVLEAADKIVLAAIPEQRLFEAYNTTTAEGAWGFYAQCVFPGMQSRLLQFLELLQARPHLQDKLLVVDLERNNEEQMHQLVYQHLLGSLPVTQRLEVPLQQLHHHWQQDPPQRQQAGQLVRNYKRSVRDEVKRRLAVQYSFLTSVARGGDVLPQQLSQLLPSMLRLAEEAQLESAVYGELGKVYAEEVNKAGGAIALAKTAKAVLAAVTAADTAAAGAGSGAAGAPHVLEVALEAIPTLLHALVVVGSPYMQRHKVWQDNSAAFQVAVALTASSQPGLVSQGLQLMESMMRWDDGQRYLPQLQQESVVVLGRPLLQVVLAAVHCVLRPHLEQKEPVSDVAGGPDASEEAAKLASSNFDLQAAVRVVAHDPLHCAEVEPEDVLQLAHLSIAAVGQFPVAAGFLFGMLAKMLEQDCAAAQVLRQLGIMQQLLQALQAYLCWQLSVGEGGSKRATAYTRALTIRLTGLVGQTLSAAEASTAAATAGEGPEEAAVMGRDGAGAGDAPDGLVAGGSSQHAVSSTKLQVTAAAGSAGSSHSVPLATPASAPQQQQLPLLRRLHRVLALTPASATSSDSVRLRVAEALEARLETAQLQAALATEVQLRQRAEQQAEQLLGEKEELQSEAEQQKRAAMRAQQQLAQAHQQAAAAQGGTLPPPPAATTGTAYVSPAGASGSQSSPSTPAAGGVEWDELADPLLAVTDPQQVSPEQAQKFIVRLHAARDGCRQMRTAFCSMLKHLSTGLYSSSARLVHELIQNAEDAHAGGQTALGGAPGSTGSCLTIQLHSDFLLLSNNEPGLLPKHVRALCTVGESTKSAGDFIGQKGLGFKSVFMATRRPYVVSGPWSFCFDRDAGRDEMAYITPCWVDHSTWPLPLQSACQLLPGHTHIYLPLTAAPAQRAELVEGVRARLLEPNFMVNLRRLTTLRFVDHEPRVLRQVHISREALALAAGTDDAAPLTGSAGTLDWSQQVQGQLLQLSVHSSDISSNEEAWAVAAPAKPNTGALSCSSSSSSSGATSQQLAFRAFTVHINVPAAVKAAEADRPDLERVQVTVAFPVHATTSTSSSTQGLQGQTSQQADASNPAASGSASGRSTREDIDAAAGDASDVSYPVCAYLPVMDLGLPYLVNADWVLVASREAVKEVSLGLNALLRNTAAELVAKAAVHDPVVAAGLLERYLPSKTPEMSAWWRRYVDDCYRHIRRWQQQQQGADSPHHMLADAAVLELVSAEQLLHCAGVRLVAVSAGKGDAEDQRKHLAKLKSLGYEQVSVLQVLQCFPDPEEAPDSVRWGFHAWACDQPPSWWEKLFKLLLASASATSGSGAISSATTSAGGAVDDSSAASILDMAIRKPLFQLQATSSGVAGTAAWLRQGGPLAGDVAHSQRTFLPGGALTKQHPRHQQAGFLSHSTPSAAMATAAPGEQTTAGPTVVLALDSLPLPCWRHQQLAVLVPGSQPECQLLQGRVAVASYHRTFLLQTLLALHLEQGDFLEVTQRQEEGAAAVSIRATAAAGASQQQHLQQQPQEVAARGQQEEDLLWQDLLFVRSLPLDLLLEVAADLLPPGVTAEDALLVPAVTYPRHSSSSSGLVDAELATSRHTPEEQAVVAVPLSRAMLGTALSIRLPWRQEYGEGGEAVPLVVVPTHVLQAVVGPESPGRLGSTPMDWPAATRPAPHLQAELVCWEAFFAGVKAACRSRPSGGTTPATSNSTTANSSSRDGTGPEDVPAAQPTCSLWPSLQLAPEAAASGQLLPSFTQLDAVQAAAAECVVELLPAAVYAAVVAADTPGNSNLPPTLPQGSERHAAAPAGKASPLGQQQPRPPGLSRAPVGSAFSQGVFGTEAPFTVEVPEHCRSLAKRLGVHTELDFEGCVTALRHLVHCGCREVDRYLLWLSHMRLYLHQAPSASSSNPDDLQQLLQTPLLYLPDRAHRMHLDWDPPVPLQAGSAGASSGAASATRSVGPLAGATAAQPGGFFSLQDVYIAGASAPGSEEGSSSSSSAGVPLVTQLAAHYLVKGLISQNSNCEYLPLAKVLLRLGVQAVPDFQDTLLTLNVLAASVSGQLQQQQPLGAGPAPVADGSSKKSVGRGGKGTLTPFQLLEVTEVYKHLEQQLEQHVRRLLNPTPDPSSSTDVTITTSNGSIGSSSGGGSSAGQVAMSAEGAVAPEAAAAAAAAGGGGGGGRGEGEGKIPLWELLQPDSPLRRLQDSLWRWHLGRAPELPAALAHLCEGITPAAIQAACLRWSHARLAPSAPAGMPVLVDAADAAVPVGFRTLIPMWDHRRAALLGPVLESPSAVRDAALAAYLKGQGSTVPFIRAELVISCPLLLAGLGVPYLEHSSLIVWEVNRFISRSSKLPQISDMFTQQLQVSAASQDAASTADRSTVHIPAPSSNGSAASSTSSIAEGTESGAAAAAAASASEGFRVVDVPYYQLDLLWCHAPLGGRLVTAADHSRWKQQDYEGVQKLQPDMQPPYLVLGNTVMLTLMDKAPEDKHRALVAALAHLLQLYKPSLGRSGALHQAAQAYHACLTETGGALQQVPLDEKEEYGHFAYAWHQVLLPPADVDRVLASINPAGLPWRATRSPGQPLPSRSEPVPQLEVVVPDLGHSTNQGQGGSGAPRLGSAPSSAEHLVQLRAAVAQRAAELAGEYQGAYLRSSDQAGGRSGQASPVRGPSGAQPPPSVVDQHQLAARRRTGDAAEALVWQLLASKYGDGFDPAQHWVSSARERLLPATCAVQAANDAAGYDFEVVDTQQWLVLAQGAAPVKCFIEVKGSAGAWPGWFYVSANEERCMQRVVEHNRRLREDNFGEGFKVNTRGLMPQAYIILQVEHADDPSKAALLWPPVVWSERPHTLDLTSTEYLAKPSPAAPSAGQEGAGPGAAAASWGGRGGTGRGGMHTGGPGRPYNQQPQQAYHGSGHAGHNTTGTAVSGGSSWAAGEHAPQHGFVPPSMRGPGHAPAGRRWDGQQQRPHPPHQGPAGRGGRGRW